MSDSVQFTVNVHAAPVQFLPNADGTKNYAIDAVQGSPFQLNIEFKGGVAPFSVSLSGAPAWCSASIAADVSGWVVVSGTVPADQPEGPVTFTVTISDAKGTSSSASAAVQ